MALLTKQDSNITELRYAEEASIGVLPASPIWKPLEPNSYSDFGGEITTIAREPITADRQLKKGVTTDLDASGGFNTDITQENLQDLLQGFFFADLRTKHEFTVASVDGTAEDFIVSGVGAVSATIGAGGTGYTLNNVVTVSGGTFTIAAQFTVTGVAAGVVTAVTLLTAGNYTAVPANPAATTGGTGTGLTLNITWAGVTALVQNDLIFTKGLANAANNGLFVVDVGGATDTNIPVTGNLVTASSQSGIVSRVGFQFASGDVNVDMTGTWPALTSTVKSFLDFGLIVGELVFVGGDLTAEQFVTDANNGFARVQSIAANRLEFSKTQSTMVTETGTGLTIRLFFGRVLKNETGSLINRRTYQLERQLGAPDDALPAQIQAEYLVGVVPSELTLNFATADKATADLTFIGQDNTQIDGPTPLKSGSRPALTEADAFNTSSDISRIRLAQVVSGNANPSALVGFLQELTVTVNNNLTPNKALAFLGSFEITAGSFEVGGSLTGYFTDVSAVQAVRNNADVTLDAFFVKTNSGIGIDMPLISLGDGRLNVEKDAAITLPLTTAAATGAKVNPALNHTLLMVFFDYLPSLADL